MLRKLTEAINVPGAELIGTAKGYDLFDIRTYAAAEQFVIENTTTPAGHVYVQNEQTFNQNINETQRLYFFVESNTNHVFGGVLRGNNLSSNLVLTAQSRGQSISTQISANFAFEANGGQATNKVFPFFLIPGITITHAVDNLIIQNNKLIAVLPQLIPEESIDLDLSTNENIRHIDINALNFGMHINNLILGDNIVELYGGMFDNVDHIHITWIEKPAAWSNDWSDGYENKIEYLEAEEIENIRHQRELEAEHARQQAAEIERLRIEREAEEKRQRQEAERQEAERIKQQAIDNLIYKKEGKEITILGSKSSATGDLVIPEAIDDLPVTKIAPFAFYQNTNLTGISIPPTVKHIGQGAFAYTTSLKKRIVPPSGCKIDKNAFYGSNWYR